MAAKACFGGLDSHRAVVGPSVSGEEMDFFGEFCSAMIEKPLSR
jgi:hypothetical protein